VIFVIFKVKNRNSASLNEDFTTMNSVKSASRDVKFIKLIFLLFLLTACSSDDKPKNLIPQDKMAKILSEIHILEAQINNLHFQHEDSSVYIYQRKRFELIKTFELDTNSFKVSLKYYLLNPDKMKDIYVEVKKLLEAKKKVIEAKKKLEDKKKKLIENKKKAIPEEIKKIDSLRRIKDEKRVKEEDKKHLISLQHLPKLKPSTKLQ
jgi:hypothetical protein